MSTNDKKILIVEDEQIIAENLRFILNEYGYTFVDVAADADEAKQLFEEKNYHLVLMDINLGETSAMDGIDLIKYLSKLYVFSFIYITANADEKTVSRATQTKPSGYIVKPFINSSIYANVEIALNTLEKEKCFSFVHKGIQQKILISEITYIKSDGSYANIHALNGNTHLIRMTLAECLELYPSVFIRTHKSILINKHNIQGYTSQSVKVNDETLPLGRTYKEYFLQQIKDIPFLN